MNRDADSDQPLLDEPELGRLVRDVVGDWTMPPIRLDQPGWRDRVREPRQRRRTFSLTPWLARVAGALGVAVVLTVAVALLGVWLTLPNANRLGKPGDTQRPSFTVAPSSGPTSGPSTSPQSTPTTAPAATSSPLPVLLVDGSLPTPSKVVVDLDNGNFAVADLATGKLSKPFGGGGYGSAVRRATDGTLYCICITYSDFAGAGTPATATAYFNRYDATGNQIESTKLDEFAGQPDPRDPLLTPAQPEHVRAVASFSSDPAYAFLGWSDRAHPVWHSGLFVIDVTTGKIVQRLVLPDTTDGDGSTRRFTDAPVVVGNDASNILVGRSYYTWDATAHEPDFSWNTDAFALSSSWGSAARTAVAADGCGDYVEIGGFTPYGGTWLVCPDGQGGINVRRIAANTTVSDSTITGASGIEGSTVAASPDGRYVYAWDPIGLVLTRVDVSTGATDRVTGPSPQAQIDPLNALGRWLVPSAQAKMLLESGISVSPDGLHVYALGVDRSASSEFGGSAGLFDFDVSGATMKATRWDPTADYVSVAVSADGRFVYAAGMPTADTSLQRNDAYSSVTVFDAQTGKVSLIAGQLSFSMLTFEQASLSQP